MNPLLRKCLCRLFLFLAYGVVGGWIFYLIERRSEDNATTANRSLARLKATMKAKHNLTNMTELDFNQFVETAYNAIKTRRQKDWSFTNGCGFTFATLTTIGYGDLTPKSALGQGLTIPFCLIGLPITMLALKTSGQVVLSALQSAISTFERRVLGHQNPSIGFVKLFWTIIVCLAFIICTFASIEMYADGWTFLEGVYCWFITFTTIGFGDYVPFSIYLKKMHYDEWLVQLVGWFFTFPYIVGLVLISSLLNLLVECSEKIKMRCARLQCCACICNANDGIETSAKCNSNTNAGIDQETTSNVISIGMNQDCNSKGNENANNNISDGDENKL